MKIPAIDPSRRAAMAGGVTALLLSGLSRPANAKRNLPCCGGNGPPIVKKNGLGIRILAAVSGSQNIQFTCPATSFRNEPTSYFVFVPLTEVSVVSYTGPGGHALVFYTNIANFSGIVYVVEPSYALTLHWPPGIEPVAYARPANLANE